MQLDALEFRSPIAKVKIWDRTVSEVALLFDEVWQRRFKNLWEFVSQQPQIINSSGSRTLSAASDLGAVIVAVGTITLDLPARNSKGDHYFVFNNGNGVISITGTINGNAAGWELVNQYQYAEFTSLDGTNWIVTRNN